MLRTINISPLSNTFPMDPIHNNLTVVDVKFESSTSMETPGLMARTGFDPSPPSHHLDDSGSLNTPTASPPGGDLGAPSNKRKRSVPKKVSVDEDNNPLEGDMGDDETVVKAEQLDFSMQSYEDIAAPDHGCDWGDIAPPSPSEVAQMDLARLEAQKVNSQQREDCPICGDRANGLHYGVYTCEGCKNFFKRSVVVTQKKPYICTYQNTCDVRIVIDMSGIKRKGARCQACRYSACLNAGMYHSGYPRSRGGRHSRAPPKQGGQEWVDMITGYLPQPGQKPQQQQSPEPKKVKTDPITPSTEMEMLEQQMGLVQEEVEPIREEQIESEGSQVVGQCEEMVNSVWRDELERERSKNREIGGRLDEKEKQLKLAENQVETMKQHMMTSQSLVEQQADEIRRLKQEIGRLGFFRNSANHYRQTSNGNTGVQNGDMEEEHLLIPADMLDVSFKE